MKKTAFSVFLSLFLLASPAFLWTGFAQETVEAATEGEESFIPPYLNSRHLFIRNYDPVEYKGQNMLYEIVQDSRGLMYFGNNLYGILEYDGISWRTIPLSNNNTAYSLTVAKDGIYVGGFNEIGHLDVTRGVSVYHSLTNLLPKGIDQFGVVESVRAVEEGVYFKLGGNILRWHRGQFARLENLPSAELGELYLVREKVYTIDSEGTVYRIDGDLLAPVFQENPDLYGDYIFRTDQPEIPPTDFILPYGEDGLLLRSWEHGLVIIEKGDIGLFDNEAANFGLIDKNYTYGSTVLPNGEYAISTTDGVVIIDQQGGLKAWINQDNGLINNSIRSIFADNQHFLWIGTAYGISQILYPSPFSKFDKSCGIDGQIRMSTLFEDALYVATSEGVFRTTPSPFGSIGIKFQKIPDIDGETGYIETYGDSILIANILGLYQIVKGKHPGESGWEDGMQTLSERDGYTLRVFLPLLDKDCRFIEVSDKYPGVVYVGTPFNGLYVLQEDNNIWKVISNIKINDQVFFGAEDGDGVLWISGIATGGYSLDFSDNKFSQPEIRNYYTKEGLPEGWYVPSVVGNVLYLYSDEAFFRYDREKRKFSKDNTFFKDTANIGFIKEAPDKNVWITKGRPRRLMRSIRMESGGLKLMESPFQRFNRYQVRNFGFDKDGVTWFGAGESLLSYDPRVAFDVNKPFRTIIRNVIVNDIPVFGEGPLSEASDKKPKPKIRRRGDVIELPYNHNSLRFDYSGLYLDLESGNQYRVWMDGPLKKKWSKWSNSVYKEYNSLPPGKYVFHVISKNLYGKIGRQAILDFKINPPWWKTMWFYGAEVSLFLMLLLVSIIMNRTGEPTLFSKTVTLVTVVILFESIMMVIEPLGATFGGGIPLIQLLLNVSMAMVFEPSQKLLGSVLIGKRKRRTLRITFDPIGHWTGGAEIPKSLIKMDNVDRWIENFHDEFQDIGRKYTRYISNDWVLDSDEKADLTAELEDFLGGLLLLRRFVSKDHPSEFSTRDDENNISYHVEIFSKHWEGTGLVLQSHDFSLTTFVEWFQPIFEQINTLFSEYRAALENQVPLEQERDRLMASIEQVFGRILIQIKILLQTFDKQYTEKELDLERLR